MMDVCMIQRKLRKEMAVCVIFLLVLYGMWAAGLIHKDRLYSKWEKRLLAQKPEYDFGAVLDGSYESAYEEWLTDQFPARDGWVGIRTRCELSLGKKEIDGVYLGKDGYLFSDHTETADWDRLEVLMTEQYGEEKVSRIHVPVAGAVLTEKVPYLVTFPSFEDDVWENLYRHRDEYIYYRTDHHWTMRGAWYAYEAWAKERGISPVSLDLMEQSVLKEDFLGTHYSRLHYAEQPDLMELYDPGVECSVVYDLGE